MPGRGSARIWIAGLFVALAAGAADAREAARLRPGERAYGELAGGESATVLVDAVEGMSFSATCRALRGTKLTLTLTVTAPDGSPRDVTNLLTVSRGGATVVLRGFVFPTTGAYRLGVKSTSTAPGGYDLDTRGVLPRRLSGKVAPTDGAAELPFVASIGDRVRCSVRPPRGVKSRPTIRRFVDADGTTLDVNAPRTTKAVIVRRTGVSRFDVDYSGTDELSYALTFVRARPSRAPREMTVLAAAGVLSGTAVVEGVGGGQTEAASSAKSSKRAEPAQVAAGELVMSLPDAVDESAVAAAAETSLPGARCRVAGALSPRGPYLVHVEHLVDKPDARSRFATRVLAHSAAADRRVAWCEANGFAQVDLEPSDPLWSQQYDFRQIRCPEAWQITRGAAAAVVAVIDTGMSTHPDLAASWLPGYDFVSSPTSAADGNGWDADPMDSAYVFHGTHVAGTIAARAENGIGISGVAPFCLLVPVRTQGRQGLGTHFDIAAGLMWAAGLPVTGAPANPYPARVINMSLGSPTDSQVLRDAMYAVMTQTNVVVVASAGNSSSQIRSYPAAYSGVVAVTAVDSNLRRTSYSNYGDWVTIAAPGGDQSRGLHGILSAWIDPITKLSGYREMDGTSMAAPHVAGAAALVLSADPTRGRSAVVNALITTALDLGPAGYDKDFGWGLVDVRAALDSVVGPTVQPIVFTAPKSLTFTNADGRLVFLVGTTDDSPVTVTSVYATTDQGEGWLSASTPSTTLPAIVSVEIDPNLPVGAYSGRVFVDTSSGLQNVSVTVFRSAPPPVNGVVIEAWDDDGKLAGRTTTGPALDWVWSMPDVPLGRHKLLAYADLDGSIAADRVDEFVGAYPIATQPAFVDVVPEDLDHADLVVRLMRYDSTFNGIGVGGGPLKGAFAVHAVDGTSGADVPGATLHLLDGPSLAATDVRGRALVVGGYSSAQTITLVADGFVTTSRVGFNTQFLGFRMPPVAQRPTRELTTTVRGLGPSDVLAYVQVGDARTRVALDGSAVATAVLTVLDVPGPAPVSVVAYDADGALTRRALLFATPDEAGLDVTVSPTAAGATATSVVYTFLPYGFPDAAASELRAEAFVRGDDRRWLTLGGAALPENSPTSFAWAKPASEPIRETKLEVSARDSAGRVIREIVRGTTLVQPSFHGLLAVRAPTQIVEPADGAADVAVAPTLEWTTSPGARVHRVAIETLDGSWRRVLYVAGSVTSVKLPSPAGAGLSPATTYRWRVESSFGIGIDSRSHDDDDFETKSDGYSSSETATFTTQ